METPQLLSLHDAGTTTVAELKNARPNNALFSNSDDWSNKSLIPPRICRQLSSGTFFLILITMSLYPPSGDMDILVPLAKLTTDKNTTNRKCFPACILDHAISLCHNKIILV